MNFCIFIVWDDTRLWATRNLNRGIGVQGWLLILHLLFTIGKLGFSSSLVLVVKPFQAKTQMTLPNCFVVRVLLCLVRPFIHLLVCLWFFVCDIDAPFAFFVDFVRPHLKKWYHNCLERVKGYSKLLPILSSYFSSIPFSSFPRTRALQSHPKKYRSCQKEKVY